MAVTCVFGMTQSGKSHLVERVIIPKSNRVIVFDPVNCFKTIPNRFSMDSKFGTENLALDKMFELAARNTQFFKVALAPGKSTDEKKAFDKVITSAFIIGEKLGSEADKILLVCDEASDICSHQFQSAQLQKLVKKGRHYNVDSLFIAQYPQMIHNNIKSNCSTVHCFRLTTAPEIPFLVTILGREVCKKLVSLPQYHFLTWENTGNIFFTDEKGKKY